MQSEVDGPANQGHMLPSRSWFSVFSHYLHKLPLKIIQLLTLLLISQLGGSSTVLTDKKAKGVDDQHRDDENVSLQILLQNEFAFRVDENITSSATRVMFNNSDSTMQQICLKMWLECQNKVYDTGDLKHRTTFLLEGLTFNKRFSGNIYYGIVPILVDNPDSLKCGPLIANPTFANLAPDRPYALVMKRLREEWRLDQQLWSGKLGNKQGMEYLANQVAAMHQKLNRSLRRFGTPKRIAGKLKFNIEQFQKALDERRADPHILVESVLSKIDMKELGSASNRLERFSEEHKRDFKKRRRGGYIRRCHGDLKAANLWICAPENESQAQERLVALDCVDFNPEFCNIDTLSDVAMLAVDIEMRLENVAKNRNENPSGQQLARHFLQTYLKAAGENEAAIWPLLEYYMTEKAMVCAYMSIVYDSLPTVGEKYLKVVLAHSQELAKHLSPQTDKRTPGTGIGEKFTRVGKRITRPLFPIAS